jgi:hypothetical protein
VTPLARSALTASCLVAFLLAARAAPACGVCGASDPTLTVVGSERSFSRLRISADLRAGSGRVADVSLSEQRLDLSVAYAPFSELVISLAAPVLRRETHLERAPRGTSMADVAIVAGDVELRARYIVKVMKRGDAVHRFGLQGGVKLPTAPLQEDAQGRPLSPDLQPGMGGVTPFAGAFYGMFEAPWSVSASAAYYLPFAVRDGAHAGDSFRTTTAIQLEAARRIAGRLGFNMRVESTGEVNGGVDPNSGGFVGYLSTELAATPVADLHLTVGAYFPVVQLLRGNHTEGTIAGASVAYDF